MTTERSGLPARAATFFMDGLLVGGDASCIRFILSPYLLTIERDSVAGMEEIVQPHGLVASRARAVRLELPAGARFVAIAPATEDELKVWRHRKSFAAATRTEAPELTLYSAEFQARQREFLVEHGIEPEAT